MSRKGITQLFKYIRLESYEDTMDGLDVAPQTREQANLLTNSPELAQDYRLRYALAVETSGSVGLLGRRFTDPFTYTLSVVHDDVRHETQVDLIETFNYLLGLRVESRRRTDGVTVITGTDAEGLKCLILWRTLDETNNATLDAWFDHNRGLFATSLDLIYVNGDHTLNSIRRPGDNWTAETIEAVFRDKMFEDALGARWSNGRGD